ncbi:restriction endonuclease subunit S [Paenibacillus motobuensis]|uniref:Restriction endonuclease subunit S n=1 Tax=Paenibacillus lutimineralis TaxID=2707005 RepID=A0A3S9V3H8_9BACL|nr:MULTISPECIES: restriction endonuclease subunit S [Paenibacillus]AZS17116.1 restriction endonuclease subunit S [Paenibacillus lutimineralis]MCM3041862.1 restriction endonuclease subunit S [Paenibacillus lutimineralis]MCM3648966.1 restriction endonuclease subunit S [Paenibacillus motobuensis]
MSREQAYLHILDAASKVQWNVAMILEAKALEAEKVRNWVLNQVHHASFDEDEKRLSEPLDIHEQVVEVLEGLTKLQNGLCSNLKTVLASAEEEEVKGGSLGGLFGDGFDLEDTDK